MEPFNANVSFVCVDTAINPGCACEGGCIETESDFALALVLARTKRIELKAITDASRVGCFIVSPFKEFPTPLPRK